mgnify:CR=1 FL=1|jgi:hypothetical protein|tara:strand:- start:423 stop:2162 length:1740 start_codon:yes stop_codon:yes gene_type:complete
MADEEQKLGTALSIVETQQTIVGNALVAASGTAVLAESTDSSMQILEQIRDIQVKTLRGISDIGKTMKETLGLDKLQDRRAREDATELAKEEFNGPSEGPTSKGPETGEKKGDGIAGFFAMIPGAGLFKKMFAPIMAFFGKSGLLVKLFGRFGPLGALILGFTLVYKYSDEIAKALAPAIDVIKKIIVQLKPLMDFLMTVGDFLIKEILEGVGAAFTGFFEGISRFINGFKLLFEGDILGGLNEILGGLLDTILKPIKAIIDTANRILEPIVTVISEFFTKLYNDIITYVTDVITSIGDWFVSLKDSIVSFFVTAYQNAVKQITSDINGMIQFVSDIFNTVYNAIAEAVTAVKNFVVGIPKRIMSFVSSMFDPIVDFFSGIGTSIKNAINGIIDSLPLPDFIKNKVKFDTTPSSEEITKGGTELAKDSTPQAKSIVSQLAENKDKIQAYAEARGLPLNLEQTMIAAKQNGPSDNPRLIFGNSNMTDMMTLKGIEEAAFLISTGHKPTAQEQLKEERTVTPKIKMADLPPVKGKEETPINVTNNNFNTSNNSVASQTDVHSGKLDTGIDPYHEKLATAIT